VAGRSRHYLWEAPIMDATTVTDMTAAVGTQIGFLVGIVIGVAAAKIGWHYARKAFSSAR